MQGETILVATDLSDNARSGAKVGRRFAELFDMKTEVIHVFDMTGYDGDKQYRLFRDPERRQKAERRTAEWFEETTGVSPDAVTIDAGAPDAQIRKRIEQGGVAGLALAMSGRGAWGRLIFGSTALKLSGRPPCITAVTHPDFHRVEEGMTIGMGTDFSKRSEAALREAAWFAGVTDSSLRIVHSTPLPSTTVIRAGELPSGMKRTKVVERARESMDQFVERNEEHLEGLEWSSHVVSESPVAGLRQFVEDQGIDWLVLGHRRPHERGGQQTVKGKWVQQMTCSTLLVPG